MKRRSFFGALAGLFVLPSFLKARNTSDQRVFNATILGRQTPENVGIFEIREGYLVLRGDKRVRNGDHIMISRFDGYWRVINSVGSECGTMDYCHLKQLTAPHRICGIPVIKVDGKYRRFFNPLIGSLDSKIESAYVFLGATYQEGHGRGCDVYG